jgi:hypothetical protein
MFLDKKEAMPQASMQCGLKKSASPDHHGVDEIIFVDCVQAGINSGVNNMAQWVFVT